MANGVSNLISRFWSDLQLCRSAAECASLFKTTITPFGFDSFACGEVDTEHRNRNVFYILEWPKGWVEYYVRSGLIEHDPVVDALRTRRQSFLWSDLREDRRIAQIGSEAMKVSATFGWTEGLVVPVDRGGTRFGLVSLAGRCGRPRAARRDLLCVLSHLLLSHLRAIEPRDRFAAPPAGLSGRERDSLRLVAAGRSDREIAIELGISPKTVHQHVEAAKRKIEARSRAELVALSISLGII